MNNSLLPLYPLATLPNSLSLLSASYYKESFSVLPAVFPLALVDFAVGPLEYAESLLFVFEVVALVFPAIWPHKQPFAMHLVVLPLAVVLAAI
jgi:hypothetical protein